MSKVDQENLRKLNDVNDIRYSPLLGRMIGINAALLYCYLLFWHGHQARSDGMIWKKIDEMQHETGLTRTQQDNAISKLVKLKLLKHKRTGARGIRHFSIDPESMMQVVISLSKTYKQNSTKPANTIVENQQTLTDKTHIEAVHIKRRKNGSARIFVSEAEIIKPKLSSEEIADSFAKLNTHKPILEGEIIDIIKGDEDDYK